MSIARTHGRLELPGGLVEQLRGYRRRVWSIKLAEAAFAAAFGVLVAFLLMFGLDRAFDTPGWPRALLFALALGSLAAVPLAAYRWAWLRRRPEQLARLLARKQPRFGDQLLGVIELVTNESEQARSPRLCEAAVEQVADEAQKRDFAAAAPDSWHRRWAWLAAGPASLAMGLLALFPAAAGNAWARLLTPWRDVPRYTFAALEPIPDRLVVPHGEPFTLVAALAEGALWRPESGTARLGDREPLAARRTEDRYAFAFPPQIGPSDLALRVGDSIRTIRVEPTLRPELTSITAEVTLPEYLGRPGTAHKDVRGGSIALVKGSTAAFAATASRELAEASVDGAPRTPAGATVAGPATVVDGTRTVEFRWRDALGLEGKEPFRLAVNGRDDEAPTLAVEDLPRLRVVLDSEQLGFTVRAGDDFGLKNVGLEWHGLDDPTVVAPARGEKVLAAGGPEKEDLELSGTFSAKSLGIEPQPIRLRVFAEDYYPGRERAYSPEYTLFVLSPEQHAIWITEQMSKWHRQALEVRDRELQLHETNKQLRALSPEELDRPENRRKVEAQASAERANGRRLTGLVGSGEELVRQAARNPEVGVGHLERWAEMLQVLKDISGNRMPSVADLLKQAAQAPTTAAGQPKAKAGPMAGNLRAAPAGKPGETTGKAPERPPVPSVADLESTQQPNKPGDGKPSKSGNKAPRLTLPTTTLMGAGQAKDQPQPPAEETVEEAVRQQRDLLAEFEKVAEELNQVLANLEGSTLVKRLKAASRVQAKVAERVGDQLGDAFGVSEPKIGPEAGKVLGEVAEVEGKSSHDVSVIMDDLQAYYERRRVMKFKSILDEMRTTDVIGALRTLGDDLKKESGVSIAQCEFWSDTLDRWAEDLVDPSNCGACPGSKSRDSLPPSVVLEVLQILEAEVNLREETRVTQQARPALASEEFGRQASKLSETQSGLRERVEKVNERIRDLPESDVHFGYEMKLLGQVAWVMGEAAIILNQPETGNPAIAAETEAIELLLQSKRINPKGGGGGGSNPGGGGGGTTKDSALALLGGGVNEKEVREDRGVGQATGESGPALPEEFRAGLDEYFNRLERRGGGGQ